MWVCVSTLRSTPGPGQTPEARRGGFPSRAAAARHLRATTFAVQPADAALFLQVLTRCAQNGFGRDVEEAATLLCRESREEVQTWAALKDLPHGRAARTRLMHAAATGDVARLRWLLARGARVEMGGAGELEAGKTALMWASQEGHVEVARELLARGANVNAARTDNGWTSLMAASEEGHAGVVRELLAPAQNANVALLSHDGESALAVADAAGRADVAALLRAAGAT